MLISPSQSAAMVVTLGVIVVLMLIFQVIAWFRIRRFRPEELARKLEDVSLRLHALEARLSRGRTEIPRRSAPEAAGSRREPSAAPRPAVEPRRFDMAEASAISGPTLIAVPHLTAPRPETVEAISSELAQRFADIWQLADDGASAETIARRSGQPIGQVELILALRRQVTSPLGSRP